MKRIKQFYRWIIKSCQYAWFLRSDWDYDWSCILKLLQYKLRRTREHIVKHNIIEDADEIAAQISYVECLIDKILADDYYQNEWDLYESKYGVPWNQDHLTEQQREQGRRELTEICAKMEQAREKDWQELFMALKRDLRGWWD